MVVRIAELVGAPRHGLLELGRLLLQPGGEQLACLLDVLALPADAHERLHGKERDDHEHEDVDRREHRGAGRDHDEAAAVEHRQGEGDEGGRQEEDRQEAPHVDARPRRGEEHPRQRIVGPGADDAAAQQQQADGAAGGGGVAPEGVDPILSHGGVHPLADHASAGDEGDEGSQPRRRRVARTRLSRTYQEQRGAGRDGPDRYLAADLLDDVVAERKGVGP